MKSMFDAIRGIPGRLFGSEAPEVKSEEKHATTPMGPKTGLHIATREGDLVALEKLLADKTEDVDIEDKDGFTPLHEAARLGNPKCVALLLAAGANVNSADNKYKITPLNLAAQSLIRCTGVVAIGVVQVVEVVELLLRAPGIDVNAPDRGGITPLHSAANRGLDSIMKKLLDAGANVDAKDDFYSTPLDFATRSGHPNIVKLLLDEIAKNPVVQDRVLTDEEDDSYEEKSASEGFMPGYKRPLEEGNQPGEGQTPVVTEPAVVAVQDPDCYIDFERMREAKSSKLNT